MNWLRRRGKPMPPERLEELAAYNARVSKGILHDPAYASRMAALQADFDVRGLLDALAGDYSDSPFLPSANDQGPLLRIGSPLRVLAADGRVYAGIATALDPNFLPDGRAAFTLICAPLPAPVAP